MAGLLERAHKARQGGVPLDPTAAAGITPEEGIELMAQIEKAVARKHDPSALDLQSYIPQRSGLAFPVSLNAAAIVLIALAAVFLPLYFDRQDTLKRGNTGTTLVGESRLVSTVRGEAAAGLRSKDLEIGRIQGTLERTTRELQALKAQAEAQVLKKEQDLRSTSEAQLAAEKARLLGAGTTSASMDQRLADLRGQLQSARDSQLAAFRRQVEADVARRGTVLSATLEEARRNLSQAEAEKARLQSQLESETRNAARAQGEQTRLAEQLQTLTSRGQREQLVLDQITASYAAVAAAMKGGRLDEARASLSSLTAYLDQEGVASLPVVQRRKTVDFFLIDALGQQVAARASGVPASAETLEAMVEAMASGDALYKTGNFATALDRYAAGLAMLKDDVPGSARLAARIADAGYRQGLAERAAGQDKAARPAVDAADSLARRGSHAEAVAGYAAVVRTWPESSLVPRAMTGIERSLAALLKQKDEDAARAEQSRKAAAADSAAAVGAELAAAAHAADAAASATQKDLIAMLDAKVKIRSVLSSDAVKARYPGLVDALDRYLQLYGDEKTSEGRLVALQDIRTVLDFMLGTKAKEALGPLWARYGGTAERTSFQQLLDRLRQLRQ